jgi:hypothetical protein
MRLTFARSRALFATRPRTPRRATFMRDNHGEQWRTGARRPAHSQARFPSVTSRLSVFATLVTVLLVGCGGSSVRKGSGPVRLSVKIDSGLPDHRTRLRFTIRCNPTGGDMPNRETLCRMIAAHPEAMLYPPRPRSLCAGGPSIPVVTVTGRIGDRAGSTGGMIGCGWPGGQSSGAFWAAVERPGDLAVISVRLHCDEDKALVHRPIDLDRVRACLATEPHWAKPRSHLHLVLDHSFGAISLSESKTKIEARFGEGQPLRMRGAQWTYYPKAAVAVLYVPTLRGLIAGFLETTSSRYRTDSGTGVGSTFADLRRHVRVSCFNSADCQHGYAHQNARGTSFEISGLVFSRNGRVTDGRVTEVLLGFGH